MNDINDLREEWKTLYSKTLPQMAKARDPAQSKWPVTLDHCFARIILDNVVGKGQQQWDKVISKPAVRNMNEQQLQEAISLGLSIIGGETDLCQLDKASLQARGKNEKKYRTTKAGAAQKQQKTSPSVAAGSKRNLDHLDAVEGPESKKSKTAQEKQSTLDFWQSQTSKVAPSALRRKATTAKPHQLDPAEAAQILDRIQSHSTLTPYRKRLYTVLLSVPQGDYTTYAAMSDYLKSSARAVGNGMRNNPFAPEVPCHRVLAADGSIGGFHGDWGKDGKYAAKKVELLRSEGIKFDGKGKVVGQPFRNFHEFQDVAEHNAP